MDPLTLRALDAFGVTGLAIALGDAMVDVATHVWNHKWKIDPVVRSLIDTDFFKLLMRQSVFRYR